MILFITVAGFQMVPEPTIGNQERVLHCVKLFNVVHLLASESKTQAYVETQEITPSFQGKQDNAGI